MSTFILLLTINFYIYVIIKSVYFTNEGDNPMAMTEKIRILLVKRKNMSEAELARRLGITPQNLNKKMHRDNFTERDLRAIAAALDCTFDASFVLNDTGEKV